MLGLCLVREVCSSAMSMSSEGGVCSASPYVSEGGV